MVHCQLQQVSIGDLFGFLTHSGRRFALMPSSKNVNSLCSFTRL